jgi:predicted Rossmann-fold nucleotide-binding protein
MGMGFQAVCVFCGCNRGASPGYEQAAAATGRL